MRPRDCLPTPISKSLRRPLDEVAERRIWNGIRAARQGQRAPAGRTRYLIAATAVAIVAVLALVLFPRRGPLGLDVDRVVLEVDAGAPPRVVRASDGSTLELSPETRLEVVENSGEAFATLLSRGRVAFDVVPQGGRRWTIECGGVAVEVIGTAFTVERDAQRTRVTVERGEVVVRGERVPDRRVQLVAGQSLDVPSDGALARVAASGPATAPAPPAQVTKSAAPPERSVPPASVAAPPPPSAQAPVAPSASSAVGATSAWRDRARAGDFESAYDALGRGGIAREATGASVDDLFALADVARLSGHAAEAAAPLQRIANEHAGDRRASMAMLTLGRLYLDALNRPGEAVSALNRAIAAGLPAGLAEDALARRVEAYARSGNREGAQAALDELDRRFPASGRAATARRWLEPKE